MASNAIITGDIILIPFPFTDLSSDKVRPALIVSGFQDDITVLFITRQGKSKLHSISIKPDKENGLKYTSNIIVSKIATLDKNMALGKIGVLEENNLKMVKEALGKYLGL